MVARVRIPNKEVLVLRKTIGLGAAVASLALVAPAGAAQGDAGLRKSELRGVHSRVATKLKSAERSLARAQGYIDDGESGKAVTALASTNRNLRSALKAVKRRVVAGNVAGAASAYAFAAVADDVIGASVNGFDGQDGDVVTALAASLDAALDSRDELVAAIDALSDSDTAAYSRALSRIASDAKNEADDIAEALSDDTLTDAAKTALNAAATQATATASAASALVPAGTSGDWSSSSRDGSGDGTPRGDCRGRGDDTAEAPSSMQ
jgi:hypothetical protein